jgi:Tfp pilus assembly protein PilX
MQDRVVDRRPGEQGFALVLAILSLMLLTFLGLTLATTTSTELQIATNYRWSQQALYNAEAGIEAARVILARAASVNTTTKWAPILPARRMSGGVAATWAEGAAPAVGGGTGRDFYRSSCDTRGGVGYGLVLNADGQRWENVSSFESFSLNGAFTLWIRRDLSVGNDGKYQDSDRDDMLIIVAEGVAPYQGAATSFTQARQATRVLETRLNVLLALVGHPCESLSGQEGMGPSGDNYNPCAPLALSGGAALGLGNAFGAANTGETGTLRPTDR